MLFSVLDAWDRLTDVPQRFKAAWTVWAVGILFVVAWVLFLVLEDMWKTMTARRTPGMDERQHARRDRV